MTGIRNRINRMLKMSETERMGRTKRATSVRRCAVAGFIVLLWLCCAAAPLFAQPLRLVPHRIKAAKGTSFTLNLPEGYDITIAAEGLRRVRFMAKSPDGRIFVTDMYDRTDNTKGTVYILEDFDRRAGKFARVVPYMTGLRNPNSIAFYTDARGQNWFYLALTDKLVRYKYDAGASAPVGQEQVLATFPDYGLGYKYGGWHLTRTIVFGDQGKLYVAVGSSCNACVEKEQVRAAILEMNADGSGRRIYASGLRNAVGLKWLAGRLYATDMGSDHLGDDKPEDMLYTVRAGTDYGWPYCYQYRAKIYADPKFSRIKKRTDCRKVPLAMTGFAAHSSPLGLEYFGAGNTDARLRDSFLVALHGSSKVSLKHGYSLVRVGTRGGAPQDFINGFLRGGKIYGRPVDVMNTVPDAFLLTDDHAGIVYYVFKQSH